MDRSAGDRPTEFCCAVEERNAKTDPGWFDANGCDAANWLLHADVVLVPRRASTTTDLQFGKHAARPANLGTCLEPRRAGLLHAVHWRMLEALGSGALPLMEWQNDVEEIFGKDADVPAVKCFDDAREMADFYLKNEDKRLEKVAWMTQLIKEKYSIEKNAALLSQTLKLQ